jgi:hypothetical protein
MHGILPRKQRESKQAQESIGFCVKNERDK